VFFASSALIILLVLYCYDLRSTNHRWLGYINEQLNNSLKPIAGDLEENEDILSKALERNKITHEELDGLYVLYGDILENLMIWPIWKPI
jgi:hypothetical protein